MENDMKKRRPGKLSIILWIFGFCLIMFGAIIPQDLVHMDNRNVYSYEMDPFGEEYEFEVETTESIDIDSAIAKIKVKGVTTKSFQLEYKIGGSYGEYTYTLTLSGSDAHMFNEVVGLEITSTSGRVIVFEHEDSSSVKGEEAMYIVLSVIPCFVGVVFIIFGFVIYFSRDKLKKVNDKIFENLFGSDDEENESIDKNDEIEEKSSNEDETVTCSYCGLENKRTNAKCEHCGAPIYRRKK